MFILYVVAFEPYVQHFFFLFQVAAETGTEGTETIAKPVVAEETGGIKQD